MDTTDSSYDINLYNGVVGVPAAALRLYFSDGKMDLRSGLSIEFSDREDDLEVRSESCFPRSGGLTTVAVPN